MDGIRAAKYAFRASSILVEILILVILAGPIAGAVSPELGTHSLGLGVELQSIQPQLQQIFSSASSAGGTHEVSVPAFNNWPLPGAASLTLALVEGGQTIYKTQPAALQLAPFQSGELDVSLVLSPSLVDQIQGQQLVVGGSMSLSEGQFLTITVSLSQS